MPLSEEQSHRYSRHILLPEVGEEGQARIGRARVFMVGAGGLGSSAGFYLAAAGVGGLTVADDDVVEVSNLQRQIAHSMKSLGRPKVESAKDAFEGLNPDVTVRALRERLSPGNILDRLRDHDVVVDGSDNFPTRFLVNDACVLLGKPLVSGAILRFEGQVMTVVPGKGPCYRCLFEAPPPPDLVPACGRAGVLGALPGVIGTLQALEVLKLLVGMGDVLSSRMIIFDGLKTAFRTVVRAKNPDCPVCGEHATIRDLQSADYGASAFPVRS